MWAGGSPQVQLQGTLVGVRPCDGEAFVQQAGAKERIHRRLHVTSSAVQSGAAAAVRSCQPVTMLARVSSNSGRSSGAIAVTPAANLHSVTPGCHPATE